ncbi:MAG: NAD(P)-dependent alcohol dehydrogenase [Deltaproteobacteria bacterium]|nr:NAD(P)-dependent alcohol dehydrogenase [Deltaproteobacteria bacterium]
MKAVVFAKYGPPDVVTLTDVPRPEPRRREVLIRIHATTVTTADWRARSLHMPAGFGLLGRLVFGIFGPRKPVLGTELAGVIEAVGPGVTRFKPGDQVFAFTGGRYGCHAEYRTMPEDGLLAKKPPNLALDEAASLSFGATNALSFLRKAGIKPSDQVLILGASGNVGTAAVQLAKHFGAEVTAVCSTPNLDLVRSLGADHVIDYTREDFAQQHNRYDIILDTTGTTTLARCEQSLKQNGRLVAIQGSLSQMLGLQRAPRRTGKKVIAGVATVTPADIDLIAHLAERGTLRPVIDRRYPLEAAAQAHAYVDTGRKRGSVVLSVVPDRDVQAKAA